VDQAVEDAEARHKFEIRVLEEQHQKDLKVLSIRTCPLSFLKSIAVVKRKCFC
jgi:hypothetical protein